MKLFPLAGVSIAMLSALTMQVARAGEMRALLVGVSEYPSLDKSLQLEGPKNDVPRLNDLLLRRGFTASSITILADDVDAASGLPTRAAILKALNDLAQASAKDDFVVLYFSGHGSQQPANRKTKEGAGEADGLFETFLPRDIGTWDESGGRVRNALVDHELRSAVDRISAKGAFVWAVFDACHSATLVRGAGDSAELRFRQVEPSRLGVPGEAMQKASARPIGSVPASVTDKRTSAGGPGGTVFFYAAQSTELAPEMKLPIGHPGRKPYGLFSYALVQALESGVPMSYRQLAQQVLNQYGGMNQSGVTPLFSGDALDGAVFGMSAPAVQQWKISSTPALTISAGALSRIDEGSVFAVLRSPLDATADALGYLRAGVPTLNATPLEVMTERGKPPNEPFTVPESAYARLVRNGGQYTLRVSLDLSECESPCPSAAALQDVKKADVPGTQIRWLDKSEIGDVALKAYPDQILLIPPALQGVQCLSRPAGASQASCKTRLRSGSVSLPWNPVRGEQDLRSALALSLHSIARSTNLLRIASTRVRSDGIEPLRITTERIPKGRGPQSLTQDQVPILEEDDRIVVKFTNVGKTPLDITLLYVDSSYGITPMFPTGGASNRLEAKASARVEMEIDANTTGLERLIVIAVQTERMRERSDFSFLAQAPLAQSKFFASRGYEDDDVVAFRDAGFAEFTGRRGELPKSPGPSTSMQVFNWRIKR